MCDDETECGCCVVFIIAISFLAIGIPCWAVGDWKSEYDYINDAISIPLFPTEENGLSYFVGAKYDGSSKYPLETIPPKLDLSFFQNIGANVDLYLVHNLWGYNISLKIEDNNAKEYVKYAQSINIRLDGERDQSVLENLIGATEMPNSKGNPTIRVRCPLPTLITKENFAEPQCYNYPAVIPLTELYKSEKVGSINLGNINENLTLAFDSLTVLPRTFSSTPELYLMGWKKTNKMAILISGMVFTPLGILLVIIGVVIALTIL